MSENVQHSFEENLKSRNTWIRLLYMVLFAIFLWVSSMVLGVVVVVQFLFALFTGDPNPKLVRFGQSLARYCYQVLRFLTFNSEEHPYPFSEWPDSE